MAELPRLVAINQSRHSGPSGPLESDNRYPPNKKMLCSIDLLDYVLCFTFFDYSVKLSESCGAFFANLGNKVKTLNLEENKLKMKKIRNPEKLYCREWDCGLSGQ